MKLKLTAVFKKFPEGCAAFVEELPGANTWRGQAATERFQWQTNGGKRIKIISLFSFVWPHSHAGSFFPP